MKKYINGRMVEMSVRELENYNATRPEEAQMQITPEERIEALEAAILELAEVVLNG